MNKKQYTDWWKNEALKNWETAIYLMKGKQNVFALFTFHLAIEKLLKALRGCVNSYPVVFCFFFCFLFSKKTMIFLKFMLFGLKHRPIFVYSGRIPLFYATRQI